MENPFELLDQRLQTIEEKLDGLIQNSLPNIWEYRRRPLQICEGPKYLTIKSVAESYVSVKRLINTSRNPAI